MSMIRNLNKVFIGDDPDSYTKDDLSKQITQAHKAYLDLLFKQKHFETYKKRFFTDVNWRSMQATLPVTIEYNLPSEDTFVFKFHNTPIKLYYGNSLNREEYPYPYSSAVYYSTAPIYSFEVRLMKGDARFKNIAFTNHLHPHMHHADKPEHYTSLYQICVGHHKFRDNIQNDTINDSNMLTSTLLDMFQWLLEVNFHDNYNSIMCPQADIPEEITENTDIPQLQQIVKQYTNILLGKSYNVDIPHPTWINLNNMNAITIRNFAYAVLLLHTRQHRSPVWEHNILTQDINYYYHTTGNTRYTVDVEMQNTPVTHCQILNNTRGGDHALCFMNDN